MSHQESAATGSDSRMVDRMLFFSDAVFAIVLTILVLELRPPSAEVRDEQELLTGILHLGRHYAAFAMSFAIGGIFWMVHMRSTRTLKSFDWPTAGANLFHLFTVTLLPFIADLLGEHISSRIAFAAYSIVTMLVAFSSTLYWLVSTRDGGRLVGGITPRRRIAVSLRTSAIGIAFGIGLPFTLNGAITFGRFSWLLMFPILALAGWLGRDEAKKKR